MFRSKLAKQLATVAVLSLPVCGAFASGAKCTFSASDVLFPGYDPSAVQTTLGFGTIVVDCPQPAQVTIGISSGRAADGNRRMAHQTRGDFLAYNLYVDSSRVNLWGDGAFGSARAVDAKGRTVLSVYGAIFPRQDVWVGAYSDTVTITLLP